MNSITITLNALLLSIVNLVSGTPECKITPVELRCENLLSPVGMDLPSPGFGWKLFSDERNQKQTAYQIIVSESAETINITAKIK